MDLPLSGWLVGLLVVWNRLLKRGLAAAATNGRPGWEGPSLVTLTFVASQGGISAKVFYAAKPFAAPRPPTVTLASVTSPPQLTPLIVEQPALLWVGRLSFGGGTPSVSCQRR